MDGDSSLKLTDKEIGLSFSDPLWAERFPPIMSLEQAADLLGLPKATIYDWRSRGLLGSCSRKCGKRVHFFRNRLIDLVFNKGLQNAE